MTMLVLLISTSLLGHQQGLLCMVAIIELEWEMSGFHMLPAVVNGKVGVVFENYFKRKAKEKNLCYK